MSHGSTTEQYRPTRENVFVHEVASRLKKGSELGNGDALPVEDTTAGYLLGQILHQLKNINLHLAEITGCEIEEDEPEDGE